MKAPSPRENAEVALRRPITVDEHQAFLESMKPPADDIDELDHLAADPRLDRPAQHRSKREVAGVLAILDSLERGHQ